MKGSGRTYAPTYEHVRRAKDHALVEAAVEASGGRLLFSSGPSTAPLFLGIEAAGGDRLGAAAYVFHANRVATRNRPGDEHRAQTTSKEWREAGHPLGFDPAGASGPDEPDDRTPGPCAALFERAGPPTTRVASPPHLLYRQLEHLAAASKPPASRDMQGTRDG